MLSHYFQQNVDTLCRQAEELAKLLLLKCADITSIAADYLKQESREHCSVYYDGDTIKAFTITEKVKAKYWPESENLGGGVISEKVWV
jgi:hypothetical protein